MALASNTLKVVIAQGSLAVFRKLFAWLNGASASITLFQAAGPLVSFILASAVALWSWSESIGYLSLFLIGLFVFVSSLWGYIGFKWIGIESERRKRDSKVPEFDCSHGLSIANIIAVKAAEPQYRLQVRFALINCSEYPIKFRIRRVFSKFSGQNSPIDYVNPQGIIRKNQNTEWRCHAHPSGSFIEQDVLTGHFSISVDYGHAKIGYSRTLLYEADLQIQFEQPQILFGEQSNSDQPAPPVMTIKLPAQSIPVMVTLTREEENDCLS